MIDFTKEDIKQLNDKGISKDKVLRQIETFEEGIPFVNLEKAAIVGEGITRFSEGEQQNLVAHFEANREHLDLLKFVPASGAATRIFKFLFQFLKNHESQLANSAKIVDKSQILFLHY